MVALSPHLAEDGCVVSVQNGLNEQAIAARVGSDRTVGCFINFGADYLGPGKIRFGGRGAFVLGEVDGTVGDRVSLIAALVRDFEPAVQVSDNIYGYLWGKLAFTGVLIGQTLSNQPTEQFLDAPGNRPLIRRLVREIARVARAEGVNLMPFQAFDPNVFVDGDTAGMDAAVDDYAASRRGSKKLYSGIWRDIMVRKRRTEIALQSRPILDAAAKHGIGVSVFERAVAMIADAENGRSVLGGAPFDDLLDFAIASEEVDGR